MKKCFTLAEVFYHLSKNTRHPELVSGSINADESALTPTLSHGRGRSIPFLLTYLPTNLLTKKIAFTLAEVLITLGIIGVVAAMTMPSLISKYQKHVWYTQFRKAASDIENAIQRYNQENGCGGNTEEWYTIGWANVNQEYWAYDNLCFLSEDGNRTEKLGSMFNVAQWITEENYKEICKGYTKLPLARFIDGSGRDGKEDYSVCIDMNGTDGKYGFITVDGMLINLEAADIGYGGDNSIVDINGPDKGPNIMGRDIFPFYLDTSAADRWGIYNLTKECNDIHKIADDCGNRLLIEGKMNY